MKSKLVLLFILIFSIGHAALPLFSTGYMPTHDGEFHIIRFWQFYKQLRAGEIFPRWAPDLNSGYGVPLFIFYYPLPNYIGSFFHALGWSFSDALKLSLATGYIASAIFCLLWLKKLFGLRAAIFGTIIFAFIPYWFVDIYVRGSLGEVLALVFLMSGLWFTEKKYGIGVAISITGMILSHNISAIMFLPVLLIYVLIRDAKPLYLWVLGGIGLASYFWLPALAEQRFVMGLSNFDYRDHFPLLVQLLFPSWGTGFSGPGWEANEMSQQIGVSVLLLIPIVIWRLKDEKIKSYSHVIYFGFALFIMIFFLMLGISQPIWVLFRPLQFLQYPWRLLALIIPLSALFAGYIGMKTSQGWLLIVFSIFAIALSWQYMRPVFYAPRSDEYYLSRKNFTDGTTTVGNSFSTTWSSWKKERAQDKIEILSGNAKLNNLYLNPTAYGFSVDVIDPAVLRINTVYYPGWTVKDGGLDLAIDYKDDGVMKVKLDKGVHDIVVRFQSTPLRRTSMIISAVSLSLLAGLGILKRYAYRH